MKKTKKLISLSSLIFLPFLTACIPSAMSENLDSVSSVSTKTADEVPTNPSSINEEKTTDDNLALSDSTLVKESNDNSDSNNLNQTDKYLENQEPIDEEETKSKDPSIPETSEPSQEILMPPEPLPSQVNDDPISEPVSSTPSIQKETNLPNEITPKEYTQIELYSAVETGLQNGTKIKVLEAQGQNQLPRKDVHLVPSKLSKLPSLWTIDEIANTLITTTDKVKAIKVEILDYSDALIYSSARTNFPHKNSVIEFTSTDGKNGFRIANYDAHDRLLDIDGTNVGSVYFLAIEYSWLKAKIQITDIHNQKYNFEEIFLFLEGVGEFIEQKGNSIEDNIFETTNVKDRFVSDAFQNWINQVAETIPIPTRRNPKSQSELLATKIGSYLLQWTADGLGYTTNLKFLTRIAHIKTIKKIENVTKLSEFSALNKIYQDLPLELSYTPELKLLNGSSDSQLLVVHRQIIIEAQNINEASDNLSIRWLHHGKPNDIDYYWRGVGEKPSNLDFRLIWNYKDPFFGIESE